MYIRDVPHFIFKIHTRKVLAKTFFESFPLFPENIWRTETSGKRMANALVLPFERVAKASISNSHWKRNSFDIIAEYVAHLPFSFLFFLNWKTVAEILYRLNRKKTQTLNFCIQPFIKECKLSFVMTYWRAGFTWNIKSN